MDSALIVCLSPAIQRTLEFKKVNLSKVNRADKNFLSISGKGINIARSLSSKKVKNSCLSHIGLNSKKFFKSEAKKEKLKLLPIYTKGDIRTCTTLLEGDGRTTEIVEESRKVSRTTGFKLFSKFKRAVRDYDIVVITGSTAPGYSENILPKIVQWSKDKGKIVIVDIVGSSLKNIIDYSPDYIKINRDEFKETFDESYIDTAINLIKKGTRIIVTDGTGDISYLKNSTEMKFTPRINPSPINSTGCGDAFTAGLVYSIINNKDIEEGVKTASDFGYRNTLNHIPGSII